MDATEYGQTNDDWLKADDLNGKSVNLEITDVVVVEFDNDQGKDSKLALMFKGKDKGIVLNKTNTKKIIKSYGPDTDKWIGKSVMASPNETPLGLGFAITPLDVLDSDIPF